MLVSRVEVYAIRVEEESKLKEEEVHVDGNHQRQDQQRGGADQLINWLISDNGEGGGVVEHVMMSVMIPELKVYMTKPVIEEFKEV